MAEKDFETCFFFFDKWVSWSSPPRLWHLSQKKVVLFFEGFPYLQSLSSSDITSLNIDIYQGDLSTSEEDDLWMEGDLKWEVGPTILLGTWWGTWSGSGGQALRQKEHFYQWHYSFVNLEGGPKPTKPCFGHNLTVFLVLALSLNRFFFT